METKIGRALLAGGVREGVTVVVDAADGELIVGFQETNEGVAGPSEPDPADHTEQTSAW